MRKSIKGLSKRIHPTDALTKYFVKKFIKLPIEVNRKGTALVSSCVEEEIVQQLQYLFYNKKKKKTGLFTDISADDLNYYCKIKKIKFQKKLKGELFDFINKLEEKHPGIKNSLMKSVKNF